MLYDTRNDGFFIGGMWIFLYPFHSAEKGLFQMMLVQLFCFFFNIFSNLDNQAQKAIVINECVRLTEVLSGFSWEGTCFVKATSYKHVACFSYFMAIALKFFLLMKGC